MDEQEQTIDLRDLLKVLKEHLIVIIVATVACGIAGFALSNFVVEKKYVSEALLYVENSANKSEDSAININDINAAQKLVNTCQILFTSDNVLNKLAEDLSSLGYTAGQYKKMISVSSVNNTEVLEVSVESNSPETSKLVADKVVQLSMDEYYRVIKNGSIEVVSEAALPKTHTFPSNTTFTLIGLVIGLFVTYFIYLLIELFDTKVKADDDLAKRYDIPVFAEIMDFLAVDKANYKYNYKGYSSYGGYGGYDSKNKPDKASKNKKKNNKDIEDEEDFDLDFEEEF